MLAQPYFLDSSILRIGWDRRSSATASQPEQLSPACSFNHGRPTPGWIPSMPPHPQPRILWHPVILSAGRCMWHDAGQTNVSQLRILHPAPHLSSRPVCVLYRRMESSSAALTSRSEVRWKEMELMRAVGSSPCSGEANKG